MKHKICIGYLALAMSILSTTAFAQSKPENDDLLDTTEKRLNSFMEKLESDISVDGPTSLDYDIWKKGFDRKVKRLREQFAKSLEGDKEKKTVGIMTDAEVWRRRYDRIFSSDDRKDTSKTDEADRQRPLATAYFGTLSANYSNEVAKLFTGVGFSDSILPATSAPVKKTESLPEGSYSISFLRLTPSPTITPDDGAMACENVIAGKDRRQGDPGEWPRAHTRTFIIHYRLNGVERSDAYACSDGYGVFVFNRLRRLSNSTIYVSNSYQWHPPNYGELMQTEVLNLLHHVQTGAIALDRDQPSATKVSDSGTASRHAIDYWVEANGLDPDCVSANCVSLRAYALNKWLANVSSYFVRRFLFATKDTTPTTFGVASARFDTKPAEKMLLSEVDHLKDFPRPSSADFGSVQDHFLASALREIKSGSRENCPNLKPTFERFCLLNEIDGQGKKCMTVGQLETLERNVKLEKRSVEKTYAACVGFVDKK